jgi:hypothetical protein
LAQRPAAGFLLDAVRWARAREKLVSFLKLLHILFQ